MLQTHDLPYQIRIGRKRNSCVSLVQKFPFRRAVQFQNVREYLGQINVYNSTLAAEANGYMVYKGKVGVGTFYYAAGHTQAVVFYGQQK